MSGDLARTAIGIALAVAVTAWLIHAAQERRDRGINAVNAVDAEAE